MRFYFLYWKVGKRCLGVAFIQDISPNAAIAQARRNGIDPGGRVEFKDIPIDIVIPQEARGRLLAFDYFKATYPDLW
jgi:hypothetical protein